MLQIFGMYFLALLDEFFLRNLYSWTPNPKHQPAFRHLRVVMSLGVHKPKPTLLQKFIPLPVIDHIFTLSCTPCPDLRDNGNQCECLGCRISSPLLLGAVCQEWRNFAWSLPIIWRRLRVKTTWNKPNRGLHLQLLAEWLERANGGPLSIIVTGWNREVNPHVSVPLGLFELLIEHSTQWRSLDIHHCQAHECLSLLSIARDRTPLLKSVSIDVNDLPLPNLQRSLTFLQGAPNLKSLSIAGRSKSPSEVDDILRSLPALRSLQRLYIEGQSSQENTFPPIIAFIDRSKCQLRTFGISTRSTHWQPVEIHALYLLLSKLDSVTQFYMESKTTNSYNAMMREIPQLLNPLLSTTYPLGDGRIILPNLRTLLYSMFNMTIQSKHIIDMIKIRRMGQDVEDESAVVPGSFTKLKTVRFCGPSPKLFLEPLHVQITEGLEVAYDLN